MCLGEEHHERSHFDPCRVHCCGTGIGRLFVESMDGRDYPVLMGLMMMGSAALVFSNLAADIVYALIDPRIRYE